MGHPQGATHHIAAACLAALVCLVFVRPVSAANEWTTDVPQVQPEHLQLDFWLRRLKTPDAVLRDPADLLALNRKAVADDPSLHDWRDLPATLTASQLTALIQAKSPLPKKPLFFADGRRLEEADLQALRASLNLDTPIAERAPLWGLVVKRSAMRTFPTTRQVYDTDKAGDIDRFQETGLFPGARVALLHASADGLWWFAQSANYQAWLPKADVAIGTRDEIEAFDNAPEQLLVTGAQVRTVFVPNDPAVSDIPLDMSVKLPRLRAATSGFLLNGQNTHAGHVVRLPTRAQDGRLQIREVLIARSQDVQTTYLPFTERHLLTQAFKFLGERYGWGHANNARDCSGFVGEIYRSLGLYLPRNTTDQARTPIGSEQVFDADSGREQKLAAVKNTLPGDLLFIPGHVMMVIGQIDGEPWVIHDVHGLAYLREGKLYSSALNGVSVTPLLPLSVSEHQTYLDRLTRIKRFR